MKTNNLLIVVSYTNFKMKVLKLMSKIIYTQVKKEKGVGEPRLDIHKIEARVI